MYPRTFLLAFCALGIGLIATPANGQYTASTLNPSGSTFSRAWNAYGGRQVGGAGSTSLQTGALWSGTPASAIPMTPTGWALSYLWAVDATHQYGMARGTPTGNAFHAIMWNGSANSFTDLHPGGNYSVTVIYASDNIYQSGQATTITPNEIHAALWMGSAATFVDLHPASGYTESHIYGAWNGKQAGYAIASGSEHAMIWAAVPGSEIDLNGSLDGSRALGMDSSRVVGSGAGTSTGGLTHALAWDLATQALTDLHPAGYTQSEAYAVSGNVVAGYALGPATGNTYHAMAWVGNTLVDLHPFLPSGYGRSYAYGIDPITGTIVGEGVNSLGRSIAFMWTPIYANVSGNCNLLDYQGPIAPANVTFELWSGNNLLETHSVTLGSGGTFNFGTLMRGTLTLRAKGSHWLAKRSSSFSLSNAGVSGLNLDLKNGDSQPDNIVDLGDFDALAAAFGTEAGNLDYNQEADLNLDGVIDLGDFDILASNFGSEGD